MAEKLTTTHVANPVPVTAYEIVSALHRADGSYLLRIAPPVGSAADADDQYIPIDAKLTAQHTPVPGDFYVVTDNGYAYVNPRHVFLHKYRAVNTGEYSVEDFNDSLLQGIREELEKGALLNKAEANLVLELPRYPQVVYVDIQRYGVADPEDETRYGARP